MIKRGTDTRGSIRTRVGGMKMRMPRGRGRTLTTRGMVTEIRRTGIRMDHKTDKGSILSQRLEEGISITLEKHGVEIRDRHRR